jgi:uncharacterized membrane protein YfcA
VLAGVVNIAAVVIFVVHSHINWHLAADQCVMAIIGGQLGVYILRRAPQALLRIVISAIGIALTVGMFLRG